MTLCDNVLDFQRSTTRQAPLGVSIGRAASVGRGFSHARNESSGALSEDLESAGIYEHFC